MGEKELKRNLSFGELIFLNRFNKQSHNAWVFDDEVILVLEEEENTKKGRDRISENRWELVELEGT